jgi:hypothetical protein
MLRTQILLMGPQLRDTIAIADLLSSQSEMEVIEASPVRGVELLALLERTEPEVLIVESRPEQAVSLCAQVLGEYPHLVVVVCDPVDQTITLNRLKVESVKLPRSSLEGLPTEIREAIR